MESPFSFHCSPRSVPHSQTAAPRDLESRSTILRDKLATDSATGGDASNGAVLADGDPSMGDTVVGRPGSGESVGRSHGKWSVRAGSVPFPAAASFSDGAVPGLGDGGSVHSAKSSKSCL